MVNVSCEKCGAQHSLAEASIPPSGKVMKCPSCSYPITVMPPGASGLGLGGSPKATMAGLGGAKLPKIPSKPRPPGTKSTLLGGPGSAADRGGKATGGALGDIPLPKRKSPLEGARGGPKRESASPLEGVQGAGAPSPRSGLSAAGGDDDILDLGDEDIVDLPAPKRPSDPLARPDSETDLPAPVGPTPTKSRGRGLDLPAPVGPTPTRRGGLDLPAPKRPSGPADDDETDLPAPVGPTPTRRGGLDLPAPKGFFDDAPELPTPKPPGAAPDLPAPKGFFDDVPAPKTGGPPDASSHSSELPAPKGFFDDIPAPSHGDKASPPAPAHPGATGALDLDDLDLEPSRMAPLPAGPDSGAGSQPEQPSTPSSPMLDLGDPEPAQGGADAFAFDSLELDGDDGPSSPAPSVPLELDTPDGPAGDASSFEGMELAQPSSSPPASGVVTFSSPSSTPTPSSSTPPTPLSLDDAPPPSASTPADTTGPLDLAAEPAKPKGTVASADARARAPKPVARVASAADAAAAEEAPADKPRLSRGQKLIAAAAVFVVAAGAGGFFVFQKWQSSKDREKQVSEALVLARRHVNADNWTKAAAAAGEVLAIDAKHDDALGLAAQAYYAAALDRGVGAKELIAKGEDHFNQINSAAAKGTEVDKAKGLRALTERNATQALEILRGVVKANRGDPTAHLYLGWAYMQSGDPAKAAKQFQTVAKKNPKRVSGLYGLGMAHIQTGEIKKARAALLKVTELDKSHIGAQVGIAQIAEVDRFNDRENRYLEILNGPDIDKKDPRAVSRAWSLAGDEALRAGRVDEASARYSKALEIDPDNIHAQIGDGKTSLAQGRYEAARERLKVALSQRPNNIGALVAFGEASLALDDFDNAFKSVERAMEINDDNWRAKYVYGRILEKYPDSEQGAAELMYRAAMKLADDTEIQPTVALSRLLVAEGRGPEALEVLRPIEAAAEKDAPLAVTLGVAYLGSKDPKRAESWFRKALERRPEDVEAHLQLGLALSAQGRGQEAIAVLEKAYGANADREDVGVRLALVYEQFEMDDKAEEIYGKLLSRPGVSLNVRGRAGRFYARTGRTDKAVTLGESILSESDRNAAGHFLRGEGLYAAGEYADAQAEYRNATFIDPQAQYYEGLGRAAEKQSLLDEALGAYQKAIGLDGKYVAPRIGRARIRVARHEYSLALDELDVAKQLDPENAEVYFYIGECLYETDQDKPAAKAYSQALRLNPKHAYGHYRLGRVYYDLDKRRDAAGAMNKATTLAEGSEEPWLADAYYLMGMAARSSGNSSLAIKGFRSFIDLAPEDARVRDAKKLLLRLEAGGR